jgi:protein TonB
MSVFLVPKRRLLLVGGALCVFVLAALFPRPRPPAAVPVDDGRGRDILLALADTAVHERRLLAPAGSNAFEFYLSVLELEPGNRIALDRLHRWFPAATDTVEQAIDHDDLDEAQRELSLLREFDGDNYLLALLAGKLDAQRQLATRRHEARAALLQARMEQAAQPAAR